MWLGIIALLDKVFGVIGQLTGFWIKKSDKKQEKIDTAQAKMDAAVESGDWRAWKKARSQRNRA